MALLVRARRACGLVNGPSSSTWRSNTAGGTFVPARTWLGADPAAGIEAAAHLVRRYLAAFGPASRPDIGQWTGLPLGVLDAGLEQLRLSAAATKLGRELVDLPRAPLPPADACASRFLPRWDNLLLARDVRTRALRTSTARRSSRATATCPRRSSSTASSRDTGAPSVDASDWSRSRPSHGLLGASWRRSSRARGVSPRIRQGVMTSWLAPDELRVGLGLHAARRARGGDDRGRRRRRDHRLRHRAGVRRERASPRSRASRRGRRTDRDQRRHGAARRRVATRRSREGDPRRLQASLLALDGLPIDLYLLHTPDPRTPWATSVRALSRLVDDELVTRVGVCNVNRAQLDEAVDLAPIAAVQVGISPFDDRAIRGGVVGHCAEARAHRDRALATRRTAEGRQARAPRGAGGVAAAHDATAAEVALAWLLGLRPLVAIPGSRTPEAARSSARAARLHLDRAERERIAPRALARRGPESKATFCSAWACPGRGSPASLPNTWHAGTSDSTGTSAAARSPSSRVWRRRARIRVSRDRPRQHLPDPGATQPRRRDGFAPRHRRAASGSTHRSRRHR